ncbi:hypothetical protein FE257_000842 [Aspergillus nanangensis]|uniref:Heterokaryon incompatibility domain-containing protein n=1 Tax=Aspergillus nanangensis TaxID=2582783 RepID=A0AAD4CEI6_ASPNN|nr:hypothetical protein FE257_000842 [Aspergillus nanangensis]
MLVDIYGYRSKPLLLIYGSGDEEIADTEDDVRIDFYSEIGTQNLHGITQTPQFGSAREISPIMNSKVASSFVKPLLQECLSMHQKCGTGELPLLPKRVIYLLSIKSLPRLYETQNEERGDYITLSYCWGLSGNLQTTTSSFEDQISGIPWEIIPQTLLDAMHFTLDLGVQYIWIDSLCIVQDDPDDWEVESSKMATIYEKSLLTLSATASSDVHGGCFLERQDTHRVTKKTSIPNESKAYARRSCHNTHEGLLGSHTDGYGGYMDRKAWAPFPVLTRGWVFQERILSTRTLHCTRDELVWECGNKIQCECAETGSHNSQPANGVVRFRNILHGNMNNRYGDEGEVNPLEMWNDLIRSYSMRLFTKPTDRLAALSGAAQKFQRQFSLGKYLAGLWSQDLASQLCWLPAPSAPSRRRRIYSPSWSWASVDCACIPEDYRYYRTERHKIYEAVIHNIETSADSLNPMGNVTSGKLVISGRAIDACIRITSPEDGHSEPGPLEVRIEAYSHQFDMACDISQWKEGSMEWEAMQIGERLADGDAVVCLETSCVTTSDGETMESAWLVLRPSRQHDPALERVGMLHFRHFSDIGMRIVPADQAELVVEHARVREVEII